MKKKEALFVQESNKRCAKVITRLRELKKVQSGIIKQCEAETRNWRQKTAMSVYFSDKQALKS